MSGSGNDFVLIDNREGRISDDELPGLVRSVCRRRKSVGADGVILVTRSDKCDFGWRYLNADGGEVEMCGNGSRCISRFAYLNGIAGQKMTFETLSGPVSSEVNGRMVKVLMPEPKGLSLNIELDQHRGWKTVDFINTGVPHVVIQVEDLQAHPVETEGKSIRYHKLFSPEGTNADFMKISGPHQLEMRTYERGVEGETLACGTGAIACALVASARDLAASPVTVKTRGGEELVIHFKKRGHAFEKVWLEGNTSIIYQGRLHHEALL